MMMMTIAVPTVFVLPLLEPTIPDRMMMMMMMTNWHTDGHQRPLLVALYIQRPTHDLDQLARDRQPQSDAPKALRPRVIPLVEEVCLLRITW